MAAFEVSRTLVKSPPEVWAELERAERLAELLGDDAIKITRAEPETTIEWQGSAASGTIEIGASGWGTKVRLTAEAADPPEIRPVETEASDVEAEREAAVEPNSGAATPEPPEIVAEAEPVAAPAEHAPAEQESPDAQPKRSLWRRLKSAFATKPSAAEDHPPSEAAAQADIGREPEPLPEPLPDPDPAPTPESLGEPVVATSPDAEAAGIELDPAPTVDYESLLTAVLDHLGSAHKRPFTAT